MDIDPSYRDTETMWEATVAMTNISQEPEIIVTKAMEISTGTENNIEEESADMIAEYNAIVKQISNPEVEISNGNGVDRMARKVGNFLRKKGINVTWFTNADNFGYKETNIYYRHGYLDSAMYIEKILPGTQGYQESVISDRPENINVQVIIGRDLISHRDILELHTEPLLATKIRNNNSFLSSAKISQKTENHTTNSRS